MELIWSQPGFKCVNEPFDIRLAEVQKALKLKTWIELQNDSSRQAIETYIRGYLENRIHTQEVAPHVNKFYRRHTSRIIFKIIHAGENHIEWFKSTFKAKVVFMIRHPLPVALSHHSHPRLEAYLHSDFCNAFSESQLELAQRIINSGTKLHKGVLDWCFQNASPLRERQEDWAILSYEQLVLNPKPVIPYLVEKLELPDETLMHRHLAKASGVKRKSNRETKLLLGERDSEPKRLRLVSKWRDKISEDDEREALEILEAFGISAYRFGSLLPEKSLWVGNHYDEVSRWLDERMPADS